MSVRVNHPSLFADYEMDFTPSVSEESKAISNLMKDIASNQRVTEIEWVKSYIKKVDKPFIQEYVTNTTGSTHGISLSVMETFEINRPDDAVDFFHEMPNRRLLFHGTARQNIFSIILNGFDMNRARPGTMFGKGMYFSDCASKAFNYVRDFGLHLGSTENHSYILLCEIALGKIKAYKNANGSAHTKLGDADSVLGEGSNVSSTAKYDEDGLMICAGKLESKRRATLAYNEYIVYRPNQIRLRYLVKLKQGNSFNINGLINNGNFFNFTMAPNVNLPSFNTVPNPFPTASARTIQYNASLQRINAMYNAMAPPNLTQYMPTNPMPTYATTSNSAKQVTPSNPMPMYATTSNSTSSNQTNGYPNMAQLMYPKPVNVSYTTSYFNALPATSSGTKRNANKATQSAVVNQTQAQAQPDLTNRKVKKAKRSIYNAQQSAKLKMPKLEPEDTLSLSVMKKPDVDSPSTSSATSNVLKLEPDNSFSPVVSKKPKLDSPSTSSAALKVLKLEPEDTPSSSSASSSRSVICSKCNKSPLGYGPSSYAKQSSNCDKCIEALINVYLGPSFANQKPNQAQSAPIQQLETFPSVYCQYYTVFANKQAVIDPSISIQDLPQMLCNYCSTYHP